MGEQSNQSVKCPRCDGLGREKMFDHMICGLCSGSKEVQEGSYCKHCLHPLNHHSKLPYMNRLDCECESESGSFLCGCQGDGKIAKSICNVCERDCGNSYCLERHLQDESPQCREKFEVQFYS